MHTHAWDALGFPGHPTLCFYDALSCDHTLDSGVLRIIGGGNHMAAEPLSRITRRDSASRSPRTSCIGLAQPVIASWKPCLGKVKHFLRETARAYHEAAKILRHSGHRLQKYVLMIVCDGIWTQHKRHSPRMVESPILPILFGRVEEDLMHFDHHRSTRLGANSTMARSHCRKPSLHGSLPNPPTRAGQQWLKQWARVHLTFAAVLIESQT